MEIDHIAKLNKETSNIFTNTQIFLSIIIFNIYFPIFKNTFNLRKNK